MSMNGSFRQVRPAMIGRLRADPELVMRVIGFGEPAAGPLDPDALPPQLKAALDALPPPQRELMMTQLRQMAPMIRGVGSSRGSADPDVGDELDVDKGWHAVHWLLNRHATNVGPPPANAVLGGTEIGEDLGYGPARYFTAEEVADLAAKLPSAVALRGRFVPSEMTEVYPGGWDEPDAWQDVADCYERVRAFYRAAADRGNAVVAWLS